MPGHGILTVMVPGSASRWDLSSHSG